MAVELELPTIHGGGGGYSQSNFTKDGIAFDWSVAERKRSDQEEVDPELVNEAVEKVKKELDEDITPAFAESSIRHARYRRDERNFYGHALREAQEVLADSRTAVEAKARLLATRHFYLQTDDPGEVLSILSFYGCKVNKEPFNWLAVSANESYGRARFTLRHIRVLIDTALADQVS